MSRPNLSVSLKVYIEQLIINLYKKTYIYGY